MENQNALDTYVQFWKGVYRNEAPMDAVKAVDGDFPPGMVEEMKQMASLYPEPYYGPFHEDIKEDLLLLLMNPGEVNEEPIYLDKWNPHILCVDLQRGTVKSTWVNADNLIKNGSLFGKRRISAISDARCIYCLKSDVNGEGNAGAKRNLMSNSNSSS